MTATQSYVKTVVQTVAAQGLPSKSDPIGDIAARVKSAVATKVPATHRLSVRMAIRKQAQIALSALNGI